MSLWLETTKFPELVPDSVIDHRSIIHSTFPTMLNLYNSHSNHENGASPSQRDRFLAGVPTSVCRPLWRLDEEIRLLAVVNSNGFSPRRAQFMDGTR